ncbi:hypothetical protein AMS68_004480 [Peltaster fructicola]|uniref:HTH APSES-type domain-containing protein n=1 Tax=Peltaster fructicola TaxID=286661 RepID=A0A6H0XW36_9PEZI|nr:hypothetical protein AMS68_004480 [Peltaster fructicola]
MAPTRSLPSEVNPLLADVPLHSILVEQRCLGQTELKVKPGQVGTTNATKPANLGKLDYAHLRVPLPHDLKRSGIFTAGHNRKFPDAYFLMRRSSDGFVSATGMFKAAFPYASQEEETSEKDYIKTLPAASTEEVAGNIWVHPDQAVVLAEEYSIAAWIAALLDPEDIIRGGKEKDIKSPPPYKTADLTNGAASKSPSEKKKSTRGARATRADSPTSTTKQAARKIATPRKRKGRASKNEDDGASIAATESVNGEHKPETVRVEVETTTEPTGDGEEAETTKVNIELPAGSSQLDLPTDAESMLEKAREMVAEAAKLEGTSSGKGKRKAKDLDEEPLPAKKAKVEIEIKKEKIKRRAITGIAAGLALGALIPSIVAALPWP